MDITLEVKRLLCPMPVIRLSEKIAELKSGDTIKIIATDKGVKNDIPAWCRVHNHKVISINELNNEVHILVEVLK
ncbi:tRNA 5-methylaminomethyl-2-thiouridine synthase TusA [hydrothermal vent metagenome]|uniref:tRNA 5-methylaminomethyl-2-thiouridine synthase TusA n=1 Tax=hydrothermal vent metagenome TaxID=652676 RepID=A0A1W1BYB4_9ZZZZ